jgi:hypothetical protein
MMRRCALLLLVVGSSAFGISTSSAQDLGPRRFRIERTAEAAGPVIAPIAADLPVGYYTIEGRETKVPALVFESGGTTYLAFADTPALGDLVTIAPSTRQDPPDAPRLEVADGQIEILLGAKPFATYRANEASKPYFYPVLGPDGVPMTRAYPMAEVEGEDKDHPHQRSFWFTHGNVNGYDFWASDPLNGEKPTFGNIRETARVLAEDGPVMAILMTKNEWLAPDGTKLLEDSRTALFHAGESPRVIDFGITLTAGDEPVTFGETKEGSFGLRVASSMDVKKKTGGRIINAEGITDTAAWGKASPWVDYTGPIAGKTMGVAILNHPSSFRYPTTWHVRDYGLFAANPFGYKDFGIDREGSYTILPGESIRLMYRVILHEGTTEEAEISKAFNRYAEPPRFIEVPD